MSDPRVRRRVQRVIDWALPHLHDAKPYEFMAIDLRTVFGNTSSNPLAKWLISNVLQQTGFYRVHEFAYSYVFRPEGIEKLLRLMAESAPRKMQHTL